MKRSMLLLVLSACGGPLPDWFEDSPWVWLDLDVQTVPAFDPKLDGATGLPIVVRTTGFTPDGCAMRVEIRTAAGEVIALPEVAPPRGTDEVELLWDARDADGDLADPGAIQVTADLWCGSRVQGFGEARSYLLRLSPAEIDLLSTDQRVPLAWHKSSLTERAISVTPPDLVEWTIGESLDDAQGQPIASPPPWHHAAVAPWGDNDPGDMRASNVPVAYIAGSTVELTMTPGIQAVSQQSGVRTDVRGRLASWDQLPTVRIVSDQLRPVAEPAWSPGVATAFLSTTALPSTIGRHDLALQWRFEAMRDGEWIPVPGHTTSTHRVYTLAGQTMVPDATPNGGAPAASWVGVLEDVMPAVEGVEADDAVAIMNALRENVHTDPYIRYNPSDTAYSTFAGRYIYWDRIWIEMSDYLDRQQGIDLYCHSVACLLSSQANHLGLETEYITIVDEQHPDRRRTFRTWLTRAAGSMAWRRWTFNSHGITILDDRVWDAAVDIDSDEDPGAQPVTPLSPMGLSFAEYNDLISAQNLIIVNQGRCDNY